MKKIIAITNVILAVSLLLTACSGNDTTFSEVDPVTPSPATVGDGTVSFTVDAGGLGTARAYTRGSVIVGDRHTVDGVEKGDIGLFPKSKQFRVYAWEQNVSTPFILKESGSFTEVNTKTAGIAGAESNVVQTYKEVGMYYNGTTYPAWDIWRTRKLYHWPDEVTPLTPATCTFYAYYPKTLAFKYAADGTGQTLVVDKTAPSLFADVASASGEAIPDSVDGKTDILYCFRSQTSETNHDWNEGRYNAQIHFLHALARLHFKAVLTAGAAGVEPTEGGYAAANWRVVVTDLRICNVRTRDQLQVWGSGSEYSKEISASDNVYYYDGGTWTNHSGRWNGENTVNPITSGLDAAKTYRRERTVSSEVPFTAYKAVLKGAPGDDDYDSGAGFSGISVSSTTPVDLTGSYDLLVLPQTVYPWDPATEKRDFPASASAGGDNPSLAPLTKGAYLAVTCRVYDNNGTPDDTSDDIPRFDGTRTTYLPLNGDGAAYSGAGGTLSAIGAWQPGRQYNYTLSFGAGSGWDAYGNPSISPVGLSMIITDWEQGNYTGSVPGEHSTAEQQ